ncbi:glycosyltransferase family 39 protein [Candidatus Sumerlaeota bacterium]|nr:glycosyltransferase family 39 protein [Candidatus Sumerlaeota bacterium]
MKLKKILLDSFTKKERIQQTTILFSLLITAYLGLRLRIYGLATKSIWYDEAFSILFAKKSLPQIIQLCKNDVLPPLYFILLHIWLKIFPATTTLSVAFYPRLLSAILGISAIPLMYLLGKRLFSPPVGILGAILLTFSPFHIYYSQEIRMYSLFFLLTLLLYIKAIDFASEPSIKNYLLLIFFNAVLLFVHYFAIFFLLGIMGLIFWRATSTATKELSSTKPIFLKSPFLSVTLYGAGVFFLFLPWLTPFLHHLLVMQFVIPRASASTSLHKILNLLVIGLLGYTPSTPLSRWHTLNIVLLGLTVLLMFLLFSLGILKIRKEQKQSYLIFLFLFALPAVLILLHIALRGRFYVRYFLPLLALVFIAVAQGLLALRYRPAITLVLAILCIFFLSSTTAYLRTDVRDRTLDAFQWLSTNAQPGELIVHFSPKSFLPFKCYDIDTKFHQVIINSKEMNIFALNLISPDEIIELTPGRTSINKSNHLWLVFHIWYAGDTYPIFTEFLTRRFLSSGWRVASYQHFSFSVKHIYLVLLEHV